MLTQQKAEKFVKHVLEEVFPNGMASEADNIYTQDVVGHYKSEEFGLSEIKNRIRAIGEHAKDCRFNVKEVILINQEILTFSCTQSWRNKLDNTLLNLLVFGIYKMRGNKVAEVWMILDKNAKSYREINRDFSRNMNEFEHNQRSKACFMDKLIQLNCNCRKLSPAELDCLYYYFHGFSSKETALELNISSRTVESHISQIKEKFHCRTKLDLRKKLFPKPKE